MAGNEEQLGLAQEIFTVLLGLHPEILERVIRVIEDSPDITDIKTERIRMRIGPRAMVYLRNSIEQARTEGIEKHEHGTEEEPDYAKETTGDVSHHEEPEVTDDEEVPMKECISFKDYLTEVSMDVDLSDPIAAQQEIKRAARMAKTSPQRLGRQQQLKAKAEQAEANAATGPTASLQKQIATMRQRLAQLEMRLARAQEQEGGGM